MDSHSYNARQPQLNQPWEDDMEYTDQTGQTMLASHDHNGSQLVGQTHAPAVTGTRPSTTANPIRRQELEDMAAGHKRPYLVGSRAPGSEVPNMDSAFTTAINPSSLIGSDYPGSSWGGEGSVHYAQSHTGSSVVPPLQNSYWAGNQDPLWMFKPAPHLDSGFYSNGARTDNENVTMLDGDGPFGHPTTGNNNPASFYPDPSSFPNTAYLAGVSAQQPQASMAHVLTQHQALHPQDLQQLQAFQPQAPLSSIQAQPSTVAAQPQLQPQATQADSQPSLAPAQPTVGPSRHGESSAATEDLECEHEGCNKKYKTQSGLKYSTPSLVHDKALLTNGHYSKCKGRHEKNNACTAPGCDARFATPNELKRHLESRHTALHPPTRVYICPDDNSSKCKFPKGHESTRRDNFKEHLIKCHPGISADVDLSHFARRPAAVQDRSRNMEQLIFGAGSAVVDSDGQLEMAELAEEIDIDSPSDGTGDSLSVGRSRADSHSLQSTRGRPQRVSRQPATMEPGDSLVARNNGQSMGDADQGTEATVSQDPIRLRIPDSATVQGGYISMPRQEALGLAQQIFSSEQSQSRSHTCSICNESYPSRPSLNKHMKRHTRPFGCPIASCRGQRFGSKDDWRRHEKDQHHHSEFWLPSDDPAARSFWCGFCRHPIPASQPGNSSVTDAVARRFKHIGDHYAHGRNERQFPRDWVTMEQHAGNQRPNSIVADDDDGNRPEGSNGRENPSSADRKRKANPASSHRPPKRR